MMGSGHTHQKVVPTVPLTPLSIDVAQDDEGLLVKLDERRAGRPPTSAAVAAQWFAQDLFEGAEDDDDDDDEAGQAQASRVQRGKRAKPSAGARQNARHARF